jgi:hypothetical protein
MISPAAIMTPDAVARRNGRFTTPKQNIIAKRTPT